MERIVDIACLQTRPMPDFDSAFDEAIGLAEPAIDAGAQVLFLPEYCGGLRTEGAAFAPPAAPEQAHPVLLGLREFAASREIWIMVGSVAVEGAGGKIINRGVMISDRGEIVGRYDKIHLFDVALSPTRVYRESERVAPGGRAVIHDTPAGRIGHTICYDLRFPHLYRDLAKAGAEVLAVPAAFTQKTGEAHWHVLNRARAIETGSFVVAPCAIGDVVGGGQSYGHSLVINPWGEVVADGGALPGIVHAQLDLDMVARTRARIMSLDHDRPYIGPEHVDRDIA